MYIHDQHQLPMHDVPAQGEDVLSLFVSDLPPHAVEDDIYRLFHFPMEHLPADAFGKVYIYPFNVTDVRIVAGDNGNSKYAFVRFPSIAERTRALYIMQGVLCIGRPSQSLVLVAPSPFPLLTLPAVRLSRAHAKDRNRQPVGLVLFAHPRSKDERQRDNVVIDAFNAQWASVDPKNTKVFVGGISQRVLLQDVVSRFAPMGTVTNVNFSKGCAFISYARKVEAARAIEALNGIIFDGKPLRVTWSRSSGMYFSFNFFPSLPHRYPPVQPLLQQQRTFVPVVPSASPEQPAKSDTASLDSGSPLSRSPSSPITPITPATPANLSLPSLGSTKSKFKTPRGSASSFSSGISNLYTLREADEAHGLEQSMAAMDLSTPSLKRRSTLGSIRHSLEHEPFVSSKPMLRGESLGPTMPLARRVSLPEA